MQKPENLKTKESEITNRDSFSLSDGIQLVVYGLGKRGGQTNGGRRTNWVKDTKESKESEEIATAKRFSSFSGNGLLEFIKEPERSEIDIIGLSHDKQQREEFQITQLGDESFWKDLSKGASDREFTVEEISDLIFRTVKNKGDKYALNNRSKMTLLLDTNLTPVMPELIEQIKTRLASKVEDFGFKSVWLVGPDKEHTFKLS